MDSFKIKIINYLSEEVATILHKTRGSTGMVVLISLSDANSGALCASIGAIRRINLCFPHGIKLPPTGQCVSVPLWGNDFLKWIKREKARIFFLLRVCEAKWLLVAVWPFWDRVYLGPNTQKQLPSTLTLMSTTLCIVTFPAELPMATTVDATKGRKKEEKVVFFYVYVDREH